MRDGGVGGGTPAGVELRHPGEIISVDWPGKALIPQEELEEGAGEGLGLPAEAATSMTRTWIRWGLWKTKTQPVFFGFVF